AFAVVFSERDHDRGPMIGFRHAGRDDSHHALMPVGIRNDDPVLELSLAQCLIDPLLHFIPNLVLNLSALAIEFFQFMRKLSATDRIFGGEELPGEAGGDHSSGGIDPGSYHETQMPGADAPGTQTRSFKEGPDAWLFRMLEHL